MRTWIRWQDWTNAVLGTYVLSVPLFTSDSSDRATIWAAEILGGLIVLVALWALAVPDSQAAEWSNAVLSACLLVAPWVLGYSDIGGAAGNAWTVGALVVVFSLWALVEARQAQRGAEDVSGPYPNSQPPARRRMRWVRRALAGTAGLIALLLIAALVIAYLWQPPQGRTYHSAYLAQVGSHYVDTPIARFHYLKAGDGPPVVLVPGGALWSYSYRGLIPALASRFTVYAVDLPGQGYTKVSRDGFGYDLASMSSALGSFMNAVRVTHACVVGHSLGGAIALYFAERHPRRVSRLVLIDAPGLADPAIWSWRAFEIPVLGEVIGKLMRRSTFEDSLRSAYFVHHRRLSAHDVDEYWAPLTRRENRQAMWLEPRRFDFSLTERGLSDLRVPTLILWGDQDHVVEPWQARELGRRIRGAATVILPACGHNVHEDCPAGATRRLSSFLAS